MRQIIYRSDHQPGTLQKKRRVYNVGIFDNKETYSESL